MGYNEEDYRYTPFSDNPEDPNYVSFPTFPTIRGKIDFKKPVPIEKWLEGRDSTPKEVLDVRAQFMNQGFNPKAIRMNFEDGVIVAEPNRSIINPSNEPIMRFIYNNEDYVKAATTDFKDADNVKALIQQLAIIGGGAGAAVGTRRRNQRQLANFKTQENREDVLGYGDKWDSPFRLLFPPNAKRINFKEGSEIINQVWGTNRTEISPRSGSKYWYQDSNLALKKGGPFDPDKLDPNYMYTSTGGGANYDPILGEDELTESFKPQWQRKARQGDKTFYYDITGHRILDVPGMDNPAEQSRYKSWLTQSLINRYNAQLINPQTPFTHFHSNQSFYDSQGMEWRLVRTDKNASGPDQPYEPMPLNEIDSRKLKAENTNEEERVLLRSLMKLNVTDRNALERENPWLIQWNSDTSGQNYHEHMIGLDETEFWNSGAGKALGYMNNDVYDLEKGLGNIVFLNDPRFKAMKDSIAEYITPSSKEEVYPGLKRRVNPVKTFTGGPYAGMNAVIGYDANPKSSTYTNLTIRAYNPSPNVNESQIVATLPNWYANVYAKDLTTGERIIPEDLANSFVRSYIDAVLEGNEPGMVALEDLTEQLLKDYGIEVEIPAPGGLQQDPAYQSLGESTLSKPVDPDPQGFKIFKTTPKIQRVRDRWWKKQFLLWQKGRYTQLELNLDEEFPDR